MGGGAAGGGIGGGAGGGVGGGGGTVATLTALRLSPAGAIVPTGVSFPMSATGQYSDGTTRDLTSDVSWSSSDATVASISSASADNGRVTALTLGTSTLSARLGAVSATTSVTVRAATLVALTMTPSVATLSAGATQRFSVTAIYDTGTAIEVSQQASWAVTPSALASVNLGLVTGLSQGTGSVTASWGGQVATSQLTVSSAGVVLQSLTLAPAVVSVLTGGRTNLRALGRYSDGSLRDVTDTATWTSTNPAVASVIASGVNRGMVNGLMDGTATIQASLNSVVGTAAITVSTPSVVALQVDPTHVRLVRGLNDYLEATEVLSNGDTRPVTEAATWTSSSPQVVTVAVVQGYAQLTALTPGTATITASAGGRTATCTVEVTSATLSRIDVTPLSSRLPLHAYVQLSAIAVLSDQSTIDLQYLASWTSSAPGTVWVGNQGYGKGWISTEAIGTATITASYGGLSGTATVVVTPATLTTIQVTPFAPNLPLGFETTVQATGLYSDNTTQDLTWFVSWTSSNAAVASVSSWGRLTPNAPGTATVRATFNGISGTTVATVPNAQLTSVAIVPAMATLPVGGARSFTALGAFSDGVSRDVTPFVTWLSSDRAVADVSNATGGAGQARALSVGLVTLTAVRQGISGTAVLTVQ